MHSPKHKETASWFQHVPGKLRRHLTSAIFSNDSSIPNSPRQEGYAKVPNFLLKDSSICIQARFIREVLSEWIDHGNNKLDSCFNL